jgi:hypothetical protein
LPVLRSFSEAGSFSGMNRPPGVMSCRFAA